MIRTIFDNVRFKGVNFCRTNLMITGSAGIFSLKDFKILDVATTTRRNKRQFMHGEDIGETTNSARDILIVFEAIAKDALQRFELIKQVNALFAPPKNPSPYDQGWAKLEFTGPDGSEWRCEAKTVERPSPSDYDNNNWVTFTVKLVSRNTSQIYGGNPYTQSLTNHPFGVLLPTVIPFTYGIQGQDITYTGPSATYPDFLITSNQNNATPYGYLLLENKVEGQRTTLLTINITNFNILDQIKIVGSDQAVLLKKSGDVDWTDITAQTTDISEWVLLTPGENTVGIYNGCNTAAMSIAMTYYDVRD